MTWKVMRKEHERRETGLTFAFRTEWGGKDDKLEVRFHWLALSIALSTVRDPGTGTDSQAGSGEGNLSSYSWRKIAVRTEEEKFLPTDSPNKVRSSKNIELASLCENIPCWIPTHLSALCLLLVKFFSISFQLNFNKWIGLRRLVALWL